MVVGRENEQLVQGYVLSLFGRGVVLMIVAAVLTVPWKKGNGK